VSSDTNERLYSQAAARTALLALASHVTGLPAASVDIFTDNGGELAVHIHNNPDGFEWWREALGLDPAGATSRTHGDFCTVKIGGTVGAVAVALVGYLPLAVDTDTPALSGA
jgi:hypothetical protein